MAKLNLTECAGLWSKWMSKEKIDEIEKNIEERRKLFTESKKTTLPK